jgi:hypothetical protein
LVYARENILSASLSVALNIDAHWHQPFPLALGGDGPIYSCPDLQKIPTTPGAYVFGRKYGRRRYPLYIGQANDIRTRIGQHLNSAKLMVGLRDAPAGQRFVACCEITFKKGQPHKTVLDVIENALIAHALAEGYELLQVRGTRFASHTISFTGNRTSESIAPRFIRLRVS